MVDNQLTDREILIQLTERVDYMSKLLEHLVNKTSSLPSGGPPVKLVNNAIEQVKQSIMQKKGLDASVKEQLNSTFDAFTPILKSMMPKEDEEH